jgi:predicted restriction endonuclease
MDRYVSNNTYSLNLSPLFCTYLLAIGIYASAKYISGDANLRKEFYKSAASQLDLLKSIRVSEKEKEYENRIRYVKEGFEPLEKTDARFETEMDEADVKEALHDVLNELYYSKNKKERMDS